MIRKLWRWLIGAPFEGAIVLIDEEVPWYRNYVKSVMLEAGRGSNIGD